MGWISFFTTYHFKFKCPAAIHFNIGNWFFQSLKGQPQGGFFSLEIGLYDLKFWCIPGFYVARSRWKRVKRISNARLSSDRSIHCFCYRWRNENRAPNIMQCKARSRRMEKMMLNLSKIHRSHCPSVVKKLAKYIQRGFPLISAFYAPFGYIIFLCLSGMESKSISWFHDRQSEREGAPAWMTSL